MAANNSSLQIEVVSKGISDTAKKLDMLGNAAARNETKVKKLTDSLGLLMVAQDSAVAKASQHAMLMSAIAQQMGLASDAAKTISKSVNKLTADLALMTEASERSTRALQRKSNAGGVVNATIRAMTTAALAYLGINFAKGIVEAADGWGMMQAKLKLATGSMVQAKQVQGDLFDMAQRLRIPLDDAAKLYTRMAVPMQRMGKDAKQTADQVEYVSLALKLNGATAGEASSVMLQYSQSVNAGRLNGAEFNAVAEGAPLILRAIEEELKATGKWSEIGGKSLKKMGADGEITFDLMSRAAQRALPKMREDFLSLPLTVDGALQRVKNAWFKAMGEMGEDTSMGAKLSSAIRIVEDNIPKIRDGLASAFLLIYNNFTKVVMVVETLIAIKLVMWIGSVATALTAAATTAATMAVGVGVAEGAILAFGRGVALLAGPVGIAIALIGVGLVQAYRAFSEMAPSAENVVTNSTSKNTTLRISMIQKEIDKINERNGVSKATAPVADLKAQNQAIIEQEGLVKSMQAKIKTKKENGDFVEVSMLGIDLRFEEQQLAGLRAVLAEQGRVVKANDEKVQREKQGAWESKYNLKTESKDEKFSRLLEDAKKEATDLGVVWKDVYETRLKLDIFGDGAAKSAVKAASAQSEGLARLRAELLATSDTLKETLAVGEKATPSQKQKYKIERGTDAVYNKASPAVKASLMAIVEESILLEKQIETNKKAAASREALAGERDKYVVSLTNGNSAIDDSLLRLDLQIAALTLTKGAVKDLAAAELERESDKALAQAMFVNKDTDLEQYNLLIAKAEKFQAMADKTRTLGVGQDQKIAYEELDKLLDPKKALNFGDALSEAFGGAGEAIGKMSKALGVYGKAQEDIDEKRKMLMSLAPDAKRAAGLKVLDKQEAQSKLRAYGDIAGGAKDLMSKHTAGYKIMATTEKAFRLAEMAMTIESTALKVWGSLTAGGAKQWENYVMLEGQAIDESGTAGMIARSVSRAGVYAVEGAAKMFSQSGYAAFLQVAGMVAVLAALGMAIGGGSTATPIDFKDRQAKQHTGTVLGDDTAKSASLANAMEMVADNSNIGLVLTTSMLSSLRGIEASMQGLAAAIFKVNGMTTGKNFGIVEGKSGGGIIDSIFGGATVTTIMDTGLSLNGTAGDFKSGLGAQQFVDVNKQESGGWFSDDESWNERSYMEADAEITKTVGRIFESINSTIAGAAESLGENGGAIRAAMDAYVISTEVSFKDLTGNDLKQALEDMFSATADSIAREVFGGYGDFQKAGEGYYETIVRVATGSEQAQDALERLGIRMVDLTTITHKTGDIATELIKGSITDMEAVSRTLVSEAGPVFHEAIAAVTRVVVNEGDDAVSHLLSIGISLMQGLADGWLTGSVTIVSEAVDAFTEQAPAVFTTVLSGVGEIIKNFSGSATDLVDLYTKLVSVRTALVSLGFSSEVVSMGLIRGAGGIDALVSGLEDFKSSFLTTAEQMVITQADMDREFKRLGLTTPKTAQAFKELVLGLQAGGVASAELLGGVLLLSGGMEELTGGIIEDTVKSVTGARDGLIEAYKEEASALESTVERFRDFSADLLKFRDSLLLGSMSPLTPAQKYAQATSEFDRVVLATKVGTTAEKEKAYAELQGAASSLLETSKVYNASGGDYLADFDNVRAALGVAADSAEVTATTAERQLDAVNEQLTLLGYIDEGVKSVVEALANLASVTGGGAASLYANTAGATKTPSQGGLDYWNSSIASKGYGATTKEFVAAVEEYNTVRDWYANNPDANKNPDDSGIAYWVKRINEDGAASAKMGFAQSVAELTGNPQRDIGSFAVGTNFVPHDQIAQIHKGEEITPRQYVDQQKDSRDKTNALLAQLIESNAALRAEVAQLREQNNRGHAINAQATEDSANIINTRQSKAAWSQTKDIIK